MEMSASARSSGRTAKDGEAANDEIEPMSSDTATPLTSEERRIVVGVEGSPCAFRALEYAADQAASTGSILQIVTAYTGLPGYGPFTPVVLDHDGAESVVSAAIDKVHKSYPGVVTKGEIVYGVAGSVLSDVSEGASALVVGTRGRGQIVGALLGSVSEYVVHHAHCTTTVVR
jgi:nucleotide-binding universal stress UspA family protein